MKISTAWIRQLANIPSISDEELISRLNMSGLEVSSADLAAPAFSGVIIAQVTSVHPHPNANNVRLCSVFDGATEHEVVCGAAEILLDRTVAFAPIGAILPDGRVIQARTIQGVTSQGMLASEAELGLSENNLTSGLLWFDAQAPLGADVRDYLALNDTILEIEITPNRGDCLSAWGLARECATLFGTTVDEMPNKVWPEKSAASRSVDLQASHACPRYLGAVLENVDNTRPSPDWLREKLRRSGIRSHSPIVDVTNYVLLELGQPLHAFDHDQLQDGIQVRFAHSDEMLELLNQQIVQLTPKTLIIADRLGSIALAGVMGGARTAVNESTRNVFLESAYFAPEAIAGTARRYGLVTDAATRFERGVDPELPFIALNRAIELLQEICDADKPLFVRAENLAHVPQPRKIDLRHSRLNQVLGVDIPAQEVLAILQNLHLQPKATATGWQVNIPTFRHDLHAEIDLIEEVVRVYGFDRIPALAPTLKLQATQPDVMANLLTEIRHHLQARGYDESIHYSFVSPSEQIPLAEESIPLSLSNPLSNELSQMRTSLWASLLQALRYNTARQIDRVRIYEMGKRFIRNGSEIIQTETLAGLAYGPCNPLQWHESAHATDFFSVKNDLCFLPRGAALRFQAQVHPLLHPTQSAAVYLGEQQIGWLGVLHPQMAQQEGWSDPVVLFEIDSAALQPSNPQARELSKFPRVQRDLAFLLPRQQLASDVLQTLQTEGGPWLESCELFDVYQGEHVPADQRSLAFRLQFVAADRTLQEQDLTPVVDHLIAQILQRHSGRLRNF